MSVATEIQRLQIAKSDIKSAIEEKGVTVGNGTIDTYAEKINKISGGADYLKYATAIQFNDLNLFGKEEVVLNLDSATSLERLFYIDNTESKVTPPNTTVKHITVNCPNKLQNINNAFARYYLADEMIERVTLNIDASGATGVTSFFDSLKALKIIDGKPLNFSNATVLSSPFSRLTSLEEIRFVENCLFASFSFLPSPNLSNDSIQSIIDGLGDLTGGTAKTVTFSATTGAKLSDEQKATITEKNWELVY